MKKRLVGCLWFPVGLCIALLWIFADTLTHNPVNKLTPFNDAVLIILMGGPLIFTRWYTRKRK